MTISILAVVQDGSRFQSPSKVGPQGAVVAIDLQAGMLRRAPGTSSSVEFEQTFGLFRLEWAAAEWKSVWRTALCLSPMAHHPMRRMVPR